MNPHCHSALAAEIYDIIYEARVVNDQAEEGRLAIRIAVRLEVKYKVNIGRRGK